MTYSYFDLFNCIRDINSNPARYGTLRIHIFWILNLVKWNHVYIAPKVKGSNTNVWRIRINLLIANWFELETHSLHECRFLISGLTDATSACCGLGKLNADIPCLPIARYCSDRTKYLFWDFYGHPTEAGSRAIVDLMFADDSQYMFPLTLSQLVSLWSIGRCFT